MKQEIPEFEIQIQGHTLVKFSGGGLKIDGQDFHKDVQNLSSLVNVLSEVLGSINDVRKPKLVSVKETLPMSPAFMSRQSRYKVVSKAS